MRIVDQAFAASHKGKGKFKPKSMMTSAKYAKKSEKSEQKTEKKVRCNYCKVLGHVIKECPKVAAKEAKKKEAGMAVADATTSNAESANVVQESEWAFVVQCSYDPSLHDVCMSVADSHVWYFDSGATKHITSQRDMFTCLEPALLLAILLHAQITPSIH